ncbi:hypothetical protein AMTRI_Chr06g174420 [Amborella trichopoda]
MIERLQRNFLWASEAKKKGIHLVKWRTICLTQAEGALGVREMEDFNIAGMKLAWWILESPSSLLARFFKHRYFRNSSIWEAEAKRGCSHAWKGILLGLSHLKDNIYKSVIITDEDTIQEDLSVAGRRVSDYIRGALQSWVLPPPASDALRDIWREVENYILPLQPKKDSLVWIDSIDGLFFIKGAWNFIRHQCSSQPIFRVL